MDQLDELMESEEVSWRDILYSVLKGMDPWNVDIAELATRYSGRVDEMREMNFRVPANVVLVCSVLLRMKADVITPHQDEYADYAASFNFIFNSDYPVSALIGGEAEPYPISVKPARVLTRRVTAEELIGAIQDALSERQRRVERIALRGSQRLGEVVSEIVLEPEINIVELIEDTYRRVMDIPSEREVVLFSEMAKTKDEIMHMFLSLLHLSNSQRITLTQERLFGEIYIKPVPAN